MQRNIPSHVLCLVWAGLLLLACVATGTPARADLPMFVIRLADGGSSFYKVTEVEQMRFEGDTLVVVKTGSSDKYGVRAIARIDFRMDPAAIKDPRDVAVLVKAVHLFQNQPNPFSPETRITFDLPHAGPVNLSIFRVDGRLTRRLVKDARQAGGYTVIWDGRDDSGERVASGIYFYQLIAPGVDESRRMILLPE
jgi:hypothetical protein